MNIRAVRSIHMPTVAASELINPLQMISSGQAGVSDYNLSVSVDVPWFNLSFWFMHINVLTQCHGYSLKIEVGYNQKFCN